jgi:hypothetical protein
MRVHPQHKTGDELVPNPHIMFFPIAALHLFPPAVHHNMVVLSLCHFVYSIPPEKGKSVAADKMTKILHHRGATIREISSRLTGKMRINDTTIISILMLMCCEVGLDLLTSKTYADEWWLDATSKSHKLAPTCYRLAPNFPTSRGYDGYLPQFGPSPPDDRNLRLVSTVSGLLAWNKIQDFEYTLLRLPYY